METDTTNLVGGDDTAAADQAATVATDAGVDATEQAAADNTQSDEPDNPITEPDEDDEFEVEEGLRIAVPKSVAEKLRLAVLRQSDYTKKTQEVAELRKGLEADRNNLRQTTEAEMNAYAQAMNLGQQLAQYQGRNFAQEMALANANYDDDAARQIQAEHMHLQQLERAYQGAVGHLSQARQQRLSAAQQETAKRIEEGRASLVREIPGWNDDHRAKLVSFAADFGFSREELDDLEADPRAARVLHAAFEGSQAKRAATKLANLAKGQGVQPAKVLRGSTAATPIKPDTNDFKAFEKMAQQKLAS